MTSLSFDLEQSAKSLLPSSVAVVVKYGDQGTPRLTPEELTKVSAATESRKLEFATGRQCAKAALVQLGHPPVPILASKEGVPVWPQNIVGSISHSEQVRIAAASWRLDIAQLGVDVERVTAIDDLTFGLVADAGEQGDIEVLARSVGREVARTALFSAKEAFFKAWYPRTKIWLDFADVSMKVIGSNQFSVDTLLRQTPMKAAKCQWVRAGNYVLASSWEPTPWGSSR